MTRKPFTRRFRLSPGQARTVAEWRLQDARCLQASGLTKHLNGAVYLGGLVLECLLKARLLERHPRLQRAMASELSGAELRRWSLIYRFHDLEAVVAEMPELVRRLENASLSPGPRLDIMLKDACSRWSVHIRYLPKRVEREEAGDFLEQVEELKRWL